MLLFLNDTAPEAGPRRPSAERDTRFGKEVNKPHDHGVPASDNIWGCYSRSPGTNGGCTVRLSLLRKGSLSRMSPSKRKKTKDAAHGQSQTGASYLVEIRRSNRSVVDPKQLFMALNAQGITLDEEYEPVVMAETRDSEGVVTEPSVILRIHVGSEKALTALEQHPAVIKVWPDTPIAPFA